MGDFGEHLLVVPRGDDQAHTDTNFLKALLAALKAHDAYTYRHSLRTVRLSLLLGRACGVAGRDLRALCLGALLHDVGKVFVPAAVLHKPGRLTAAEWAAVKRHPREGARLLAGGAVAAGALRVVAEHHERWDGRGYPAGLGGAEIDPNARVVAVADAFDAMTSARAYRPAGSHQAAVAELERCAGTQFDPRVVAAFGRVVPDLAQA
ncbi:MAG TPA: HD-GYP domain-containing protein [Pyrinomonadaceae bacterium]|jgi:HD-GYP domain-containing protein (c-di-GMP phosphodiesterase class II)